jgi:hypothetical protein
VGRDARDLLKLLDELAADLDAASFVEPVDVAGTPGYAGVVSQPMDFKTLRARLGVAAKENPYLGDAGAAAFGRDLELVWSNCQAYNAEGSNIWMKAKRMRMKASAALAKHVARVAKRLRQAAAAAAAAASNESSPASSSAVSAATSKEASDWSGDEGGGVGGRRVIGSRTLSVAESHLLALLRVVRDDPNAAMFLTPVDEADAPGYSTMIATPMDLGTIELRLRAGHYRDVAGRRKGGGRGEFLSDVRLVFANCQRYNAGGSEIWSTAERLRAAFERAVARPPKRQAEAGGAEGGAPKRARASGVAKASAAKAEAKGGEGGCALCGSTEHGSQMLLCGDGKRGCDRGFHIFCLAPPLSAVPDDDWFCVECSGNGPPKKRRKLMGKRRCLAIIDALVAADGGVFFASPVDFRDAPGYFEQIAEPMDLGTIRARVEHGSYDDHDGFARDLELIWGNCQLYNVEGSLIWNTAESLRAKCARLVKP